jgi:hypothetical protein
MFFLISEVFYFFTEDLIILLLEGNDVSKGVWGLGVGVGVCLA